MEQKHSRAAVSSQTVIGTVKCGGRRTVKVQKRPNHSLHPPRRFWSMCLQLKKRMEEMEKALSGFSESGPKAVLETHQVKWLQRGAFRRCTLSTALAPSSLQYVPAALLTQTHGQGRILL